MKTKIILFFLVLLLIAGSVGFAMIDTSPPNLTIEQTLDVKKINTSQ